MNQTEYFEVELVEKELVEVELTTVDVIPTHSEKLQDLADVSIQNLLNKQYIRYNSSTHKWENISLDTILQESVVYNELPTKLTSKIFRTAYNYKIGTLQVYLNGIKEKYFTRTGANEFTFDTDTIVNDIIEVSYIRT